MAWIRAESSNLKKIKVQGMDDDVHFTDLRYAEVSSDVASLLSTLDGVSSVAEPATPGEYYGSDVDNNVITVEVVSDTFDDITVLGRADVSLVDTGELSTNTVEIDYSEQYPQSPRQVEGSGQMTIKPHPDVSNPVLTANDITDVSNVDFVADSFIVPHNGQYHMFFEVSNDVGQVIAHASSPDGLDWTYNQVVLDSGNTNNGFLSYPYVMKYEGDWLMFPSQDGKTASEVWIADSFPNDWSLYTTLSSVSGNAEWTVWKENGYWWMIINDRLWYNDVNSGLLDDNYIEHSESNPIFSEQRLGNPAGRPIVRNDNTILFLKDSRDHYGDKLRYIIIDELTPTTISYSEPETSPLVSSTEPDTETGMWDANGYHTIDGILSEKGGHDFFILDGKDGGTWSIGVFVPSEDSNAATRVYFDGTQNTGSGSSTQIPFNNITRDIGQNADLTNGSIIVPSTGFYRVSISIGWTAPASTNTPFMTQFRMYTPDGSSNVLRGKEHVAAAQKSQVHASDILYLIEGESYTVQAGQNSGAELEIEGSEETTWFSIQRFR